ncbi:MAG: hypothetical protein AAF487_14125 [Bacteroidota bacterium]
MFFVLKSNAIIAQDSLNRVNTAIKINPTLFFRGELPVYLEQKITGNLSLEVAYIWTKRDVFSGTFDHDLDDLSGLSEVETGNGFKGALRWYLRKSQELDGPYISAEYSKKELKKYFFQMDTLGLVTNERILDRRNFEEYKLLFGMQRLGYYSNFFFDFYGGIGYKIKDFEEVHQEPLRETQPSHFIIINNEERISFYAGFKIGLGF